LAFQETPYKNRKMAMQDLFAEDLEALRARSLDRHLREITVAQGPEVEIGDRRLVNFSSNDYLGLANDPRLREAATSAVNKFGVGAGASRLITGTQSPHLALERALAKWKATEAALVSAADMRPRSARFPPWSPKMTSFYSTNSATPHSSMAQN
jgi:7-keto-8-aminopelargonate synthetase-like enzyme